MNLTNECVFALGLRKVTHHARTLPFPWQWHLLTLLLVLASGASANADTLPTTSKNALVLMSDFGTTERFVASMKGVAFGVDSSLNVQDLTHHIRPYNIWQASYVLAGTIEYWPQGTVFVSVVDPGVGTSRRSVVAKTRSGHFVVTPDNGSLTLIADGVGIEAVRIIDETRNRRPGTENLHTFHGRDVYSYTGARLAAGKIDFKGVGPELTQDVLRIAYQPPQRLAKRTVVGALVHTETPFGNVVTNIPQAMLAELGYDPRDNNMVRVTITKNDKTQFDAEIPFTNSFGFVGKGEPLLYSDSLETIGLAVNQESFAAKYGTGVGAGWAIQIAPMGRSQ